MIWEKDIYVIKNLSTRMFLCFQKVSFYLIKIFFTFPAKTTMLILSYVIAVYKEIQPIFAVHKFLIILLFFLSATKKITFMQFFIRNITQTFVCINFIIWKKCYILIMFNNHCWEFWNVQKYYFHKYFLLLKKGNYRSFKFSLAGTIKCYII